MGLKFEATPENIAAEVERLQGQIDALGAYYTNPRLMQYFRNKVNGKETGTIDDALNRAAETARFAATSDGAITAV